MSSIGQSSYIPKPDLAGYTGALPSTSAMNLRGEVRRLLVLLNASEDYIQEFECPWDVCLTDENNAELVVRSVRHGDEEHLEDFGSQLGHSSRELFAPYPWEDRKRARDSFEAAIRRSMECTDAAYLTLLKGKPIAHFVLWGTSSTCKFGGSVLRIPTLGVAVADSVQGRGIGRRCVRLLQLVAHKLRVDAVELTTAKQNSKAANLYLTCEFQEIGMLSIPLGVDPSMSPSDCNEVETWREERHMVYIVAEARSPSVREYLLWKERENARYAACNISP